MLFLRLWNEKLVSLVMLTKSKKFLQGRHLWFKFKFSNTHEIFTSCCQLWTFYPWFLPTCLASFVKGLERALLVHVSFLRIAFKSLFDFGKNESDWALEMTSVPDLVSCVLLGCSENDLFTTLDGSALVCRLMIWPGPVSLLNAILLRTFPWKFLK